MIGKALFRVILIGISWLTITFETQSQPCPELKRDASSINQSYLEITSPDGNQMIALPQIMVFPEGKERIYCLLPDLLTSHKTPIIQWNELVLKKGLNSTALWHGDIDRADFYPTPCLPILKPANFKNASSSDDFVYETNGNNVTLQGTLSFADIEGNRLQLHLNITDQTIPKPQINNLTGKLYSPSGEMEIVSGEIRFEKNKEVLRGSGLASSAIGNQGFEFTIPNYTGQQGVYLANEGDDKFPAYAVYRLIGNPNEGMEIAKYELQSSYINFSSFFDKFPLNKDSLDFNKLLLRIDMSSNSIAVDPKPEPVQVPLFNTAYHEVQPEITLLQETIDNEVAVPQNWQEDLKIKLNSFPIWEYKVKETESDDKEKTLIITNEIAPGNEARKNNASLNMDQVKTINNGFADIFQSFDENSDTLRLKESILSLFSENNLATTASAKDSFEDFLVTTVTEFRNQESIAMENHENSIGNLASSSVENSTYMLWLDKNGRFPTKRHFEFNDTEIQIHYGDTITLIASNPIQGAQKHHLAGNPGLYDILQFYGVLKALPLAPGFETNLGFFDLSVHTQTLSTNNQPKARNLIVPEYIHAAIKVEEEVAIDNQEIFKIYVKFQGLNNNLFVESLQSENSGIYYLSKSRPHKIIKAIYDEGIILE